RRAGTVDNARFREILRPLACLSKRLCHGGFDRAGEIQAFSNLRTDGVVLICGNSDRCQDADDRDHDHQFDQRQALLDGLHGVLSSVENGSVRNSAPRLKSLQAMLCKPYATRSVRTRSMAISLDFFVS